ncbi:Uncharacterised protein [Mycobacteroides abscessus subsp. abscessus]|nr:Uncharacterised protein [Mycobacteroides abscessus subsp. abscessus]
MMSAPELRSPLASFTATMRGWSASLRRVSGPIGMIDLGGMS